MDSRLQAGASNETQDQLPRALCACHAAYAHDGKHLQRKSQACSRSAASPGYAVGVPPPDAHGRGSPKAEASEQSIPEAISPPRCGESAADHTYWNSDPRNLWTWRDPQPQQKCECGANNCPKHKAHPELERIARTLAVHALT